MRLCPASLRVVRPLVRFLIRDCTFLSFVLAFLLIDLLEVSSSVFASSVEDLDLSFDCDDSLAVCCLETLRTFVVKDCLVLLRKRVRLRHLVKLLEVHRWLYEVGMGVIF